jgi:hypothetical protein
MGGGSKGPILMEVTRRPQALRTTPMLLAVTPLPSPLTTPPVTNTYFISLSLGVVLCARVIVAVVFVLMTEREMFCENAEITQVGGSSRFRIFNVS